VVSILFSTMMLARRNSFFLRAYAFATIAPPSSSIEASSPAAHSSRLFASTDLSERTSPSKSSSDGPSLVERYLSITGPSKLKSFGGLSYVETPEALQRVVFVLGGPGSGKGTQSDLILKNYPCVHLSAGQLLREETEKEGSPHGQMIEECLVAGRIVPVEISLALLEQAMREAPGKSLVFLIDGFPRNYDNLDGWTARMPKVASVSGVLHYDCPLEVLEKRILERAKDSGRSDDNLESLRKRFKTFNADTMPVVNILGKVAEASCMKLFEIAANRPIETVWEDTQEALNSVIANDVLAENWKLLEAVSARNAEKYAKLCSEEMMADCSPTELLEAQELCEDIQSNCISKAELSFVSGTKVVVSYERSFGGSTFKETRIWSHTVDGWKMVHFFRSPLEKDPKVQ